MSAQKMGPEPTLQPAFAVEVQVLLPHTIGDTGSGFRRIFPIVGGRVLGPRLSGTVLPVTELYARYAIRTDDGNIIDVVNAGLMHGLPARDPEPGDAPAEPDLFCRTTPRFEASAPTLRWLNEEVFVGTYGPGTDPTREGDFTVRVDFFIVR